MSDHGRPSIHLFVTPTRRHTDVRQGCQPGSRTSFWCSEWELEMEGCPMVRTAGCPQTPTGLLRQPAAQPQADSLPVCHLAGLWSAVASKDGIRQLRSETDALIPDDEVRLLLDTVKLHVDRGAGW